ncbi:hypothetical protein ScPMuIL_016204 [Solemya velum]
MKKQEASDDSLVINKDATGNGSSPGPIASHGLCHRLTEDGHFRNKFLQTVFLCWANIGLGWVCGQHGPSFVDLQIITNVDLEKGAMFITAISAGWLVGSLVSGIVFDFFNKPLLIVVSCLGLVVTVVPIPWCTTYSWMVAINFVSALFKGALCAGLTVFCVTLWRKEGRTYIQALHFAFALGGILSPLALEPYLAPRVQVPSLHAANGSLNNYSEFQVLPSPNFDEKYRNSSAYGIPNTAAFFLTHGNNSGLNSTGKTMMFINGESRIHYAFIMSGTLVLSAAIPFIYFYTKSSTGQKVAKSLVCTGLVLVVFAITRCFGNILIGHGTMELEITVNGNGTTREKMMIRGDFTEETIDV